MSRRREQKEWKKMYRAHFAEIASEQIAVRTTFDPNSRTNREMNRRGGRMPMRARRIVRQVKRMTPGWMRTNAIMHFLRSL